MPLKQLPRISCSLNMGDGAYIYNLSYSYEPQEGVKMTLFFVNESGVYDTNNLLSPSTPVSITLDGRAFNMYAISWDRARSSGRRVIKVDFIDETLKLSNYYVALTGQGCGPRIYPLGTEVDKRTPQEQYNEENDPRLNNEFTLMIKKLTRFEDIEYPFADFIEVLREVFAVEVTATYDPTVTRGFPGSFKEVLNAWCAYFNIAYYFENNVLKIVNPESLNLTFPEVPADALDDNETESLEGTFTKTAYAYFRQEGGEKEVLGYRTSKAVTVYPLGSDLTIPQPAVDLYQVAAAQYGKEYWFLYNWINGTVTTECGWEWIDIAAVPSNLNIRNTIIAVGEVLASVDRDKFDGRFEFYKTYGERVAGRYYVSKGRAVIAEDKQCEWFLASIANLSPYNTLRNPIDMVFFQQGVTTGGIVPSSQINKYYTGIELNDNRLVFYDQREIDLRTPFTMTPAQLSAVQKAYNQMMTGSFGSNALDYSEISTIKDYFIVTFPNKSDLQDAIPEITTEQINLFKSQYAPSLEIRGFLQLPSRPVYYGKLEECRFRSSVEEADNALNHILVPRQVSDDVPVVFTITNPTPNTYGIERDLSFVEDYLDTEILDKLALPQLQRLRTRSFTLNHLSEDIVLTDFVTMGLAGLSIDLSESGMTVTYTFSNAVQKVPISEVFIDKLELNMKNSWVSKYNPPGIIN